MSTTSQDFTSTAANSAFHLGAVVSELTLQIVSADGVSQSIPLPIGKCTVGSSGRCQVHLTSPAVRPLHCLIVHGSSEVSVTRWAPGVTLNGEEFQTSEFAVGDTLQIGDVQLQLCVADNQQAESIQTAQESNKDKPAGESSSVEMTRTDEPVATVVPESPVVEPPASETTVWADSMDHNPDPPVKETPAQAGQVERLRMATASAQQRSRNLVNALRELRLQSSQTHQQMARLQEQLDEATNEHERLANQLEGLQEEVAQRESQSAEEINRLISELTGASQKVTEAEAITTQQATEVRRLKEEVATLLQQREQFEQVRTDGEQQRAELAQAMTDHERSVKDLKRELEQAQQSLQDAESREAEQHAVYEQLQQEKCQLEAEQGQWLETQQQHEQRQQQLEESVNQHEQQLLAEVEQAKTAVQTAEQGSTQAAAELQKLQTALDQLQVERDELLAIRSEFEEQQPRWKQSLDERDEQIIGLKSELEELHFSTQQDSADLAEQSALREQYQKELEQLRSEHEQLVSVHTEESSLLQDWEKVLADRDRRIDELEHEHDGICQALQSVEKGAFEQVDFCKKLEDQLAKTRARRDELEAVQDTHDEAVRDVQQALAEREQQVEGLSNDLATATERKEQLEAEIANSADSCQTLETQLEELREQCQQLMLGQTSSEQSRQEFEQTRADYQQQVAELTDHLDVAHDEKRALEQSVAEITASSEGRALELAEWEGRYRELAQQQEEEIARSRQADQKLAECHQKIELFEVDLRSGQAELKRSEASVVELEQAQRVADEQLSQLREELAEANSLAAEEAVNPHLGERTELAEELEAARHEQEHFTEEPVVADESSTESAVREIESGDSSDIRVESLFGADDPPTVEEPESDYEPTSFIKQYSHLLKEGEQPADEPLPQPHATPEQDPFNAPTAESSDDESGDEALEAYMMNMMERVCGDSSAK